jgi:DNA-binding phage protein
MKRSKKSPRIEAGAAFEELLAREFPTARERREFTAEVRAELATLQALSKLDEKRRKSGLPKAAIAKKMGTPPPVVTRFFKSGANPTLQTFARTLSAMGLQAEIRYKKARPDDLAIRVVGR